MNSRATVVHNRKSLEKLMAAGKDRTQRPYSLERVMEIYMTTDTQDATDQIDAGLYLRAQKQIRSWSWGRSKKKSTNLAEAATDPPWAGLAEWLRAAHSLLDGKTTSDSQS